MSETPKCPQCESEDAESTVHLDEKWSGPGLYLAVYWCSQGHEWSVRSKPWGNDQRAILREARRQRTLAEKQWP